VRYFARRRGPGAGPAHHPDELAVFHAVDDGAAEIAGARRSQRVTRAKPLKCAIVKKRAGDREQRILRVEVLDAHREDVAGRRVSSRTA